MKYLLAFITAMALSMAIIPVMARFAPRLGMIDRPDPRKVHATPIPRAGGLGIVLGALVPVLMWLPVNDLILSYVFGAIVLLIFGIWDDIQELGHYVKFIGQFIAVLGVVYYGDLYVTHLPFMDADVLPESIGQPFTVFALVGMINAINHSDGLDGLAGGMILLSLGCMAYLAYLAGSPEGASLITIALATLGGVFGFLRYNTHPARVFMGDGGSQFLGFTVGFLAVYFVEQVNPAVSPALPALMLGLPIVDILAVFAQRIYHGMNWFRASKNHIHHRLLQLGFDHYETVVIIYSIQIVFVVSAIFLAYESDLAIVVLYFGVCTAVFLYLITAENMKWHAHSSNHTSRLSKAILAIKSHRLFTQVPVNFVAVAVAGLFIGIGIWAREVPRDFGITSIVLALLLSGYLVYAGKKDSIVVRAVSYVAAAFMVYLETKQFHQGTSFMAALEFIYFSVLAVAVGIAIRYDAKGVFKTTPMDYLVIFIVLFAGFLMLSLPEKSELGLMAVKLVILFYACELVFTRLSHRWYILNFATLASLSLLSFKAFV